MTCIATAPVSPRRAYQYDTLGRPTSRSLARQGATRNDAFTYNDRSELISDVVDGTDLNGWDYDRAVAPPLQAALAWQADACSSGVTSRPILFTKDDNSVSVACTYDYMGRRATKVVTENGQITSSHRFLYRGYLQIACCDRTRANHPCLWLITWDPTQPVATRPLAIQKDSTWYTYGWDLTKNIWEAYTTTGYIGTAYTYTAYGQVTANGSITQPIQWSSEYNDTELGLVYYNYRHYNSVDGRWIGRDLLPEQLVFTIYNFVKNSPAFQLDTIGLDDMTIGDCMVLIVEINSLGFWGYSDEFISMGDVLHVRNTFFVVVYAAWKDSYKCKKEQECYFKEFPFTVWADFSYMSISGNEIYKATTDRLISGELSESELKVGTAFASGGKTNLHLVSGGFSVQHYNLRYIGKVQITIHNTLNFEDKTFSFEVRFDDDINSFIGPSHRIEHKNKQ